MQENMNKCIHSYISFFSSSYTSLLKKRQNRSIYLVSVVGFSLFHLFSPRLLRTFINTHSLIIRISGAQGFKLSNHHKLRSIGGIQASEALVRNSFNQKIFGENAQYFGAHSLFLKKIIYLEKADTKTHIRARKLVMVDNSPHKDLML